MLYGIRRTKASNSVVKYLSLTRNFYSME